MTARSTFDHELELLNLDLIKMGGMAEEAIEASITAFKNHDAHLAHRVIDGDIGIDDMEKQIEAKCLSLIVRQQPVAGDLRKISTALKMITDIERIGDNAADIAELTVNITGEHIFSIVQHIPKMAEIAVMMVHESISAFISGDLARAKKIIDTDDEVDELFCNVKDDLSVILKNGEDTHKNSIDFLMIAKYLERIADHAVNICEWVEFSKTGTHKNQHVF